MKAKIRAMIVLFVLCIFFTVTFALLPSGSQAAGRAARVAGDAALMITNIHVADIQAIAIANTYGLIGIINNPTGITVVSHLDGDFNAQHMRALVYFSGNLPGIRRLDNFPIPDAEEIENSLARFSLILTGGHEYNFAILRQSHISDDYFLFFEEQLSTFLISQSTAEWFLRDPESFFR